MSVLKSIIRTLSFALATTGIYFIFSMFTSFVLSIGIDSKIIPAIVADAVLIVPFAIFYKNKNREVLKPTSFKLSGYGWAIGTTCFILVYIFSQLLGNLFNKLFPVEYMSTYTQLSDIDTVLYTLLSITIAPIVEELIFRGLIYKFCRIHLGILYSTFVSSVFFAFIHGTTAHIPVTVFLTMFVCIVYELTGKLRWCIVIHALYNLFGLVYIYPSGMSTPAIIIGSSIVFVGLILGLIFIPKLSLWLNKGGLPTIEEIIDKKRNTIKGSDE